MTCHQWFGTGDPEEDAGRAFFCAERQQPTKAAAPATLEAPGSPAAAQAPAASEPAAADRHAYQYASSEASQCTLPTMPTGNQRPLTGTVTGMGAQRVSPDDEHKLADEHKLDDEIIGREGTLSVGVLQFTSTACQHQALAHACTHRVKFTFEL